MLFSALRLLVFALLFAIVPNWLSAQTCLLVVERPPNSPTVTRAGGNTVWGSGSLRLSASASGDWLVYLRAHLNFRPQGSSTWSEVTYNETATSVADGTAAGFSYSSGLAQATLQPRGNGDYQITLSSHGRCSGQDYPLAPTNPGPSDILTVRRPTITTGVIQGVWWFGEAGKDDGPNGYYSSAAVTGTPNWNGTLTYTISAGSPAKARLTCTTCSNTVVQALGPSGGCTQDVVVTASADGFAAEAPVRLMVNRPAGRYPLQTYFNSAASAGYWSKDYFTFTDLCIMSMSSVAYHETFPGAFITYWPGGAGAYWTAAPPPGGWPAYRQDQWTTWDDLVASCSDSACNPQTVVPAGYTMSRSGIALLMQQPIVALQQMWWVGDSSAGSWKGQLANQCRQTLYQDHGEDINYW